MISLFSTKRFILYEDAENDNKNKFSQIIDDRPPLTPDQIKSIERGFDDIQSGDVIDNEIVFSTLEKKIKT